MNRKTAAILMIIAIAMGIIAITLFLNRPKDQGGTQAYNQLMGQQGDV